MSDPTRAGPPTEVTPSEDARTGAYTGCALSLLMALGIVLWAAKEVTAFVAICGLIALVLGAGALDGAIRRRRDSRR